MTSHEYAFQLQQLVELLLARNPFDIPDYVKRATVSLRYFDKAPFIESVRSVGNMHKEFDDEYLTCIATEKAGGELRVYIQRNQVCTLVRPAEYDCIPLLSTEEESQLAGVRAAHS